MKTDEYIATLGAEDQPVFIQYVLGFDPFTSIAVCN